MKPLFFQTPAAFRTWLGKHHAKSPGLWAGFYAEGSGKPGITRSEAVDEALCFGWTDGTRETINDLSYRVHFAPRRVGSAWGNLHIKRTEALILQARMQPAGLKSFYAAKERNFGITSSDQRPVD